MDGTFKKIYLLIFVLTVFPFINSFGGDEPSVELSCFKLPEYNKDTKKLDYIVYGDKARTVNVMVMLEDMKVEWIGTDISDVKATISTPKAEYDRATKIIRGDDKVHFRSPEMDADGVGFDVDHEKQMIHIRSNVRVTLKQDLKTMSQIEREGSAEQKNTEPVSAPIETQ